MRPKKVKKKKITGLLVTPAELPSVGPLATNKDILAVDEVDIKETEVPDAINH